MFHVKKKKKVVIPLWLIQRAYEQLMNISDTFQSLMQD